MKKLFFLIAVLSLSQNMFSQINYGIKGGVNYSNTEIIYPLTSEFVTAPNEFKIGYQFGVFANIPISKRISANAEFLFSEKGSISPKTPFAKSFTLHLSYINLPLLVEYKLLKGLGIQAGVQLGYLTDLNNDLRFIYNDYSLDYLAGIEYFISKFGFGLRYEHSLIYISDIEIRDLDGIIVSDLGEYSKNIQAYIAYKF